MDDRKRMRKYIIKVNDVEYHSYKELCTDLDIDFGEFMRFKHDNPEVSQGDLLSHFYEEVWVRMTDSSLWVNKKHMKERKGK